MSNAIICIAGPADDDDNDDVVVVVVCISNIIPYANCVNVESDEYTSCDESGPPLLDKYRIIPPRWGRRGGLDDETDDDDEVQPVKP